MTAGNGRRRARALCRRRAGEMYAVAARLALMAWPAYHQGGFAFYSEKVSSAGALSNAASGAARLPAWHFNVCM